MDLANFYSGLKGDNKTALTYHNKSIDLFAKLKDSAGLAKAHYNTIITAMESDNYNKAYLHLIQAKRLLGHTRESFEIGLDILFAEYYFEKEDYTTVDSYLIKAIEEAKKQDLNIELESAYDIYSESLFAQERFEEAFDMRKEYERYLQQGLEELSEAEVETISAKFQVDEYRKDVKAAELENQFQAEIVASQGRLNTVLMILSVAGMTLMIVLFLAFRKRKELVFQLKKKNKEYLEAKERSEQLSRSKSNFFSTVSHELRTPLYGVIGLSTILLEDESLKSHEKDLKSLKFSADYLLALINDVLQINKIDSDKLEDDRANFDLCDLLRTIAASFEYMRIQHHNELVMDIGENVPKWVHGNSIRLSQILMNLVGNAIKFTENGTITIRVKVEDESNEESRLRFEVEDTGIGIAQEKQELIYDEFSQGDSLNYNYQGTGLGLPIVKKLLASSNSEIQLKSTLGEGSNFSFCLNFGKVTQDVYQPEATAMNKRELEGKKILIVEDNRINQIVTLKILEKNGVQCFIANNGMEAIERVGKGSLDLILMDINMPVMDGITASKEIRKFNTHVPILALTAVEVEELRSKIYEAGMDDIIVKPYDASKFEQTILKNLRIKDGNPHLQAM
ncbi:hypothetical protein BST85_12610 [Aureitalea marina]|uniref:histidine kinase n=2 Tax=Aureitalea marina TaxID=930804 RepID=A0A2S7KTW6_9FLAO|nr:hypothetical protein BST85_12610 [Aureitalea marina]